MGAGLQTNADAMGGSHLFYPHMQFASTKYGFCFRGRLFRVSSQSTGAPGLRASKLLLSSPNQDVDSDIHVSQASFSRLGKIPKELNWRLRLGNNFVFKVVHPYPNWSKYITLTMLPPDRLSRLELGRYEVNTKTHAHTSHTLYIGKY